MGTQAIIKKIGGLRAKARHGTKRRASFTLTNAAIRGMGGRKTGKRQMLVGFAKPVRAMAGVNQVASLRQQMGVSQEEFGRVIGYSTRSIAGWESGKSVGDPVRQKLVETERLVAAMAEIVAPDTLGEWMRTPNPAFEGQPPIQVIERGESDRLWRMIFQIDANVAS